MGKLRRVGLNGNGGEGKIARPNLHVVPFPAGKGKAEETDFTKVKYQPEAFNSDLFQVISLGSSSSGRKIPLTKFVRALIEADGFLARAAAKMGIHYSTLKKHMKEYPKLKQLVEDINEMMLDLTESRLKAQIKAGNLGAIQYYLNCKGRHRGWISDPKALQPQERTPVFIFKKAEGRKAS